MCVISWTYVSSLEEQLQSVSLSPWLVSSNAQGYSDFSQSICSVPQIFSSFTPKQITEHPAHTLDDPWILTVPTRPRRLPPLAGAAELCTSAATSAWTAAAELWHRHIQFTEQHYKVHTIYTTNNQFLLSCGSTQTEDIYYLYWKWS